MVSMNWPCVAVARSSLRNVLRIKASRAPWSRRVGVFEDWVTRLGYPDILGNSGFDVRTGEKFATLEPWNLGTLEPWNPGTLEPYNRGMLKELSARERAHLKARAHALEPVVHAGNSGVTDTLVAEVDRALTSHELIKVKIGTDDRQLRVAIGNEICARTGAAAVHRVGKVVILWRPRPEEAAD